MAFLIFEEKRLININGNKHDFSFNLTERQRKANTRIPGMASKLLHCFQLIKTTVMQHPVAGM